MRALVPIAVFLGLSGLLYLAFLAGLPQLVSVVLLIPLLVWWRRRKDPEQSDAKPNPTLRRALLLTLGLYLLVMTVRTPSIFFLAFPLEKTPLIYLLVAWIILVERRPLANYGFRTGRLVNQTMLGGFLYLASQLIPLMLALGILVFSYGFNPVKAIDLSGFLFGMPFQTFAVGVSEEGFFRGYIQTTMMGVTGTRRAILYQAALFGIWHFVWHLNPLDLVGMFGHVVGAFLFGVFTGVFYKYTRSIAGLALFHGLANSVELATQLDFTGVPLSIATVTVISAGLTLLSGLILILLSGRITAISKTRYEHVNEKT